jgi:predicted PurR-regulated permease PerM
MSKTVKINPLLVLVSILVGASIGDWIGGFFGGFVAALLAIPAAGSTQVIVRAIWQSTAPPGLVVPPPPPAPAAASTQPVSPGSAAMPGGAEPAAD